MIIQFPLTNDPIQSFTIQLGSLKYIFTVQWNDMAGYWVMDISAESSQTILVTGLPILLGCDMWQPLLLGNGSLIAWDESGTNIDASADDLGSRVNVYWFSLDEVKNVFAS